MPTSKSYKVLTGTCPDEKCQAKLFFPSYERSIECTTCGQRHEQNSLQHLEEVTNTSVALQSMIRNMLVGNTAPKKGAEMVKVLGLSNYHCKLLSSFLTYHGMDRKTGKAYLLQDMNQSEIFDCAILGDRAFVIDPEHIDIVGYGRDISGSASYLADTQKMIEVYNDGEERLIPIHADGDGHCLVHAISRALVGRELFWHPLRINLKHHFQNNLFKYKELFKDFIDLSEWQDIIDECDPDFQPPEGELLGLRNIHVFGLANVLKRPIILLDSLNGMQSSGDYSALFLPGLVDPHECRGKSGELNKPLCIAWSSSGRNHYIPLVGIKKAPLPKLPRCLVPKPWGISETLVDQYLEFDSLDCCTIGGDKCLQDSYILRLAAAMEEVFMKEYKVHPSVVADVHHYIYKRTGVVGVHPKEVLQATQRAVQEHQLYRCLTCDAVCEQNIVSDWFKKGGVLYSLAEQKHGKLCEDKLYSFPMHGISCNYDATADELIPDMKKSVLEKCAWCHGSNMRLINGDGSIQYHNGDRTKTSTKSNHCNCGFKHYWDGLEYDNLPELIPVTLEWGNKVVTEKVPWFQYESDPFRNSNVYEIANNLIQKHFPGVFGSERLVQKVVDQILEQTKKPEDSGEASSSRQSIPRESSPSKIILTGYKTLHKEELTMSEKERRVKQQIESNAPLAQRKTAEKSSSGRLSVSPRKMQMSPKHLEQTDSVMKSSSENGKSSSDLSAKSSANIKMIRVVSSDGNQLRIPLNTISTFSQFCEILEKKLGIPTSRQRILYGFPPKELQMPDADHEDDPLPFQHGDKVTVEILPDSNIRQESAINESDGETSLAISQRPCDGLETTVIRDKFWHKLQEDMQNSNIENIDAVVTSLMLSATLSNQSLWSYVQNMPEVFTSGGAFYLQVARDVGLVDGKHYSLPFLTDKVFRYNAENDRLELCFEPYGHFAVEPGIEERILAVQAGMSSRNVSTQESGTQSPSSVAALTSSVASTSSLSSGRIAGSSGVVISKSKEMLSTRTPFQGQGYVLSGNLQQNIELSDLGIDDEKMDIIDTLDDDSAISESPPKVPLMTRKAPGVSVLNPEVANHTNRNAERLQTLAQTIEGIWDVINSKSKQCDTDEPLFNDVTMSDAPPAQSDTFFLSKSIAPFPSTVSDETVAIPNPDSRPVEEDSNSSSAVCEQTTIMDATGSEYSIMSQSD